MPSATVDRVAERAGPRRRGKSRAKNFTYRGPLSVMRLELDVADAEVRRRLERQWETAFRLRRALQRDAAARCRAYWAADRERATDPKALRDRLGLTRKDIEATAKAHIDRSGWMRNHLTKAVGLHIADEVWQSVDRHLFADASGHRQGPPRVGLWRNFTRIPGRARSHTKPTLVWETWRLVGTLDGHLSDYRHPQLPASVCTAAEAAGKPAGDSVLAQPSRLSTSALQAASSLRDHTGALAVVFSGMPAGDLVLPVRLPQGSGEWAYVTHFLANPDVWHKIDLVRVRDRRAPGGWRYYAHLLVHKDGYRSPATQARRSQVPAFRRAGIDVNVSNLSVASFPDQDPAGLVVEQVTMTHGQQASASRAAHKARARQRALDRSRRNANPDQYDLSARQRARSLRRARVGLPAKQVTNPGGARRANADGRPLRAHSQDATSRQYQLLSADHRSDARARSQAKHARARETAARIVATHGNTITTEDCNISTWTRLWGKRIHLFSPGMLIAALAAECAATGGRLHRAATHTTALSQHCLCGQRVPKSLAQRTHRCPACGLRLDRDIASAALAACVEVANPDDPTTARVNFELARAVQRGLASQQEERVQSTGTSHRQDCSARTARTGSRNAASAEQRIHNSANPRTDQEEPGRRGSSRKHEPPGSVDA
jgi:Putative transposase DNA-binding domain